MPVCPFCSAPRTGGRFCEDCGFSFSDGRPPRPLPPEEFPASQPRVLARWSVTIAADREYFATVQAEDGPDSGGLRFPPYCPPRTIPLIGDKVRIGRRSTSRGLLPEIDLGVPPADPGVSHAHAVLIAVPEGWTVVDPGSTNGTTINGGLDPIPVNTPVPLQPGDRVHVGAWTTLTLNRAEEGP
ncbi:FHA domain-containing protein [Actinomadura flavalba]|uniref:FHA domain-containing protein n=1 Tax=Actinomadura flavalba TaxID=1120938 RepID=UPI00037EC183|nr:FHA domain-containing protein [Actinomadura flavalba]